MKKFTKVCLITSLILLIIGIAFYNVFGFAGGFSQLESAGNWKGMPVNIGNLRFGFAPVRFFGITLWDEEDGWDFLAGGTELAGHKKTIITEHADTIRDIEIDIGGANLIIEESDDNNVWLENKSSSERVRYEVEADSITIQSGFRRTFLGVGNVSGSPGEVCLYLPAMALETIELNIGGGNLDGISLTASEIDLELGAGKITLDGISARDVDLSIGTGNVEIAALEAEYADLEVGAGNLKVNDMEVSELDLEIGAGNANLEGKITEDATIDCGVGNLDLLLIGNENDYDYSLECAVGKINIGNNRFSGLASERYVDHNSGRKITIDCAIGTVNVYFKE